MDRLRKPKKNKDLKKEKKNIIMKKNKKNTQTKKKSYAKNELTFFIIF